MIKKDLGRKIASLRRLRGLSQEALAERSSYSVEFVSLVERGTNSPSVTGLERIAKALRVEVRDLFDFGGKRA